MYSATHAGRVWETFGVGVDLTSLMDSATVVGVGVYYVVLP